jgi:hypothetical protein
MLISQETIVLVSEYAANSVGILMRVANAIPFCRPVLPAGLAYRFTNVKAPVVVFTWNAAMSPLA